MEALLLVALMAAGDWREQVLGLALAGEHRAAITLAERARVSWLAPHIAAHLAPPRRYLGWVVASRAVIVYRLHPEPGVRILERPDGLEPRVVSIRMDITAGRPVDPVVMRELRRAIVYPIQDWLDDGVWTMAMDGLLADLPLGLVMSMPVVHATSARTAALSSVRVQSARRRPPSLFAYARAADLPAATAEVALAAAAVNGSVVLLGGTGSLNELRMAAYDGRLGDARYVLIAAHAAPDPERRGVIRLELGDSADTWFAPTDTLHLRFNAELVILSACETAVTSAGAAVAGFAQAGLIAGVGMTLLTRWRVDDAASAQFVAALFAELAEGADAAVALATVQRDFASGRHGAQYRAPFYWASWQLWGG